MPHFTITTQPLVGFAAENAPAGGIVKVITKCPLATSDEPQFHVWMKHVANIFLSKGPVPLPFVHRFLILLHADNTADVHVNDFPEMVKAKATTDVKAGQQIFRHDISDIVEVQFPGIGIKRDDVVIFGQRTDWRFSLYFNFERDMDAAQLASELGGLKNEAEFREFRVTAEANIARADIDKADATIFTEGRTDCKHLASAALVLSVKRNLLFADDEKDRGADDLLNMCRLYAEMPH